VEVNVKYRVLVLPTLALTFTLAAPVYFVVQTVLADQMTASSMTAAVAIGVLVLVAAVTGLPRRSELRGLGRPDTVKSVAAGVLGVFGSQYLVLANRYSDAPPGSEVIFFTTAAWGVLVILMALVTRRKPTVAQMLAALIALAAAAAVLANWERPSSFSPFARYPSLDFGMLVAGAAWATFSVLAADLGRRHRLRVFLPLASLAGAALAVVIAIASPGRLELLTQRPEIWLQLFVASCTLAAMVIAWTWLVAAAGTTESASLLFLPAVTLTILGVFERRVGGTGPSPLLWTAVAWACVAVIAGALGVALLGGRAFAGPREPARESDAPPGRIGRWLAGAAALISGLAAAGALVALALPALTGKVQGTINGGGAYSVAWTLPGAETPAGWIALGSILLVFTAALALVRGAWRPSTAVLASALAGCALLSVPALLRTPLRTWTLWIPGEVQQDYGTEYASLVFSRAQASAITPMLALAAAGVLVTVAAALVALRSRTTASEYRGGAHESDGVE
jgi:drug/metabolite transporter (DMT)-like permease